MGGHGTSLPWVATAKTSLLLSRAVPRSILFLGLPSVNEDVYAELDLINDEIQKVKNPWLKELEDAKEYVEVMDEESTRKAMVISVDLTGAGATPGVAGVGDRKYLF